VLQPVNCPRDANDNCTFTICVVPRSSDSARFPKGCSNITTDCTNIGAIVGAVTGGAIAGIVIGAGIIAAACIGGTAYAASNLIAQDVNQDVKSNPLYKQKAQEAVGLGGD